MSAISISFHRKGKYGWELVKKSASDCPDWSKHDQEWIQTLLRIGREYIIVGNTMYQVEK